jgi:hypothetical protein
MIVGWIAQNNYLANTYKGRSVGYFNGWGASDLPNPAIKQIDPAQKHPANK